jgi:CO/xanthine dehydrogenase Mo-binding subunit
METPLAQGFGRRDFLVGSGVLVVSFAMPSISFGQAATSDAFAGGKNGTPVDWLDSWIEIGSDGNVVAAVGKIESGMGISTAFAQIVAEELDVPLERVAIRMGDTASTPDQRGTGASNGISQGGRALRHAGAEARAALLSMASAKLGVPVDRISVKNGVTFVTGDPSRKRSYGELIGGRRFDVKVTGKVKPKDPKTYTLVGKPVPRRDIPPKVTGEYTYLVDHRVPGMLHGRVIRPPEANAKLVKVNAAQKLPGLVKVVTRGEFVGVVCEREEQAIRAAAELEVQWSKPEPLYSKDYDALYEHLRTAKAKVSDVDKDAAGDVEAALASAAKVIEARYEYPFQSHACMGPACAVADVRPDGVTVWMGGQKPYPLRQAMAEMLKMPAEKVRVVWLPGPGSYGMNDADDAAGDAALLSQAVGKPVRVQWMRHDGTGWDPKSPPAVWRMRGGLNAKGEVVAYDYHARGYSARIRPTGTSAEADTLAAQLYGMRPKSQDLFQFAEDSYKFPNKRQTSDILAWEQSLGTPLRTSHLRDPDGPQTCFASESFIDELAAAAGADPVEFRLRYLTDPRDKAVVAAAAKASKWDRRAGPNPKRSAGPVLRGRGIAYAPRNGATVAIVARVEVRKDTGAFRVTRFTVAHDCGLVINPKQLEGTIEANLIQTLSRAMHEQVLFDSTRVLSVDWASYPIVDMTEVPDAIDIVILNNRPDAKSVGAGEPATRPTVAAVANALFDATGVRFRRVPFTAESIKAGLQRV